MKKISTDLRLPTLDMSYEEIVQWLFNIREIWVIKGIPRRVFSDFKKPKSGNGLTKREILEYIQETFESSIELKEEQESQVFNADLEDKYYVFEIEYLGPGGLISLETADGDIVLAKGIPIALYDKGAHLLQIARERPEEFTVIARDYYTHEAQMLDTYRKVRDKNKSVPNKPFFNVW